VRGKKQSLSCISEKVTRFGRGGNLEVQQTLALERRVAAPRENSKRLKIDVASHGDRILGGREGDRDGHPREMETKNRKDFLGDQMEKQSIAEKDYCKQKAAKRIGMS